MSRPVYKSNGGAIGDGVRVTRVSGGGSVLSVMVDNKAERYSEIVLTDDQPGQTVYRITTQAEADAVNAIIQPGDIIEIDHVNISMQFSDTVRWQLLA